VVTARPWVDEGPFFTNNGSCPTEGVTLKAVWDYIYRYGTFSSTSVILFLCRNAPRNCRLPRRSPFVSFPVPLLLALRWPIGRTQANRGRRPLRAAANAGAAGVPADRFASHIRYQGIENEGEEEPMATRSGRNGYALDRATIRCRKPWRRRNAWPLR